MLEKAEIRVTDVVDEQVLSTEALDFVARLVRRFRPRLGELLRRRQQRQASFDASSM